MLTKSDIRKKVNNIEVGKGYKRGYILSFEGCNESCQTKSEVIESFFNELKENPNQSIFIYTFDNTNNTDDPGYPLTLIEKNECIIKTGENIK